LCSVNTACDTSFFFWHRNLLPRHLQQLYSTPTEAYRLPYVIAALKDSMVVARRAQDATGEPIASQLHDEVLAELRANIIQPLCTAIEEDLRYQTLTEVVTQRDQQARNPLQANVSDLTHLFKLPAFKFNGETVNISSEVCLGVASSRILDTALYACMKLTGLWRCGR
jgi:WASH complex subunit 7